MGEEKRHQMMQNLFGDQSEEEEEIDSEHESNPQPSYASDEGDKGTEAEGEGEVEGQGEAEVESEAELREVEPDPGESEGERDHVYQEVEANDQREESNGRESDSEENQEYGQRATTIRRREVQYAESEDEEVDQSRRKSLSDEEDQPDIGHTTAEIHDVFGDSDEEEAAEYAVPNNNEHDSNRFPMEEEEEEEEEEGSYENNLQPEDMLADEDLQYASEEEPIESRHKEKPVGPPLEFEIPLKRPPAHPEKMNMIKVSNIMGIDPKPFDPKTYKEEDVFVTDESGSKKRIRLENNIVRWRMLKSRSGAVSYDSNARFVRWSDGSVQLLIGNEVLDINVQDAQHEQAHLFLRHGKGILQSQGRLLQKMKVMPSSLTSNSHRLLTALVDSRHKKVYKVKNCVTDIDPEREKEEKERALSQTIRANAILNRKREKVNRKYTQNVDRGRQLSPGFLEEALDEDDEADYYETRRSRRNFEEELEVEARAEKRIMHAKRQQGHRDIPRKSSIPAAKPRRPVEFSESEREESEYETDGDEYERSPPRKRTEVEEPEYEDDEEEEHVEDDAEVDAAYSEDEEPNPRGGSGSKRKGIESDEESPPRKAPTNQRRKAFVYDSDEE